MSAFTAPKHQHNPHPPISRILVVIPARNEEERLGTCLHHVQLAMDRWALESELPVQLLVVLDSTTDGSLGIVHDAAHKDPRVSALNVSVQSAGIARDLGIRRGTEAREGAEDLNSVLVACTDGDTFVPDHWLTALSEHFNHGADAVLGTVEPDPRDTDPVLARLWHERHDPMDGTDHIYGANMAFRAGCYIAAGGFPDLPIGEDQELISTMRRRGMKVTHSREIHAVTSGRTQGRTEGGFAGYLRTLSSNYPSALPRLQ